MLRASRSCAKDKGYTVVLMPGYAEDRIFEAIVSENDPELLSRVSLAVDGTVQTITHIFPDVENGSLI